MSEENWCPICGRFFSAENEVCPVCNAGTSERVGEFRAVVESSFEKVEQTYGEYAIRRLCELEVELSKMEAELDEFLKSGP